MSRTLAIGIPVYNGALQLSKTLTSIESVREFQSGDLEILIADNHSDDQTFEIAKKFSERYPNNVKVIRNATNLLFRRNLEVLCSKSDSKFIWFLGVGETVSSKSISPLLDYLQGPEGSLAKMGTLSTSDPHLASDSTQATWSILHSEAYANSCFSEAISLTIVERNIAIRILKEGEPDSRLERTFWPHLEMAIYASSFPTFQVKSPGLVSIAQNDNGWWYHSKYTIPVYVKQLEILQSASRINGKTWWASALLEQRRGWHFAALVFEASLNGIGLKISEVFWAYKEGVRLTPTLVGVFIVMSPRWVLKTAQGIKRALL
jgi:glycosyltransferase involved in cell wall biosynthesis